MTLLGLYDTQGQGFIQQLLFDTGSKIKDFQEQKGPKRCPKDEVL